MPSRKAAQAVGARKAKVNAAGLYALRKAFKAMGSRSFDRHMSKVHKQIAKRVIDAAKPGLAAQSSDVAAAVSPQTSATGARIKVDAVNVPWAPGTIFGAGHNFPRIGPSGRRWRGYNQFRSWWGGPYHIWPEVDEVREAIATDYAAEVHRFLDEQGVPR